MIRCRSMCKHAVQTELTIGRSGTNGNAARVQESRGKPSFCTGNCQQCPRQHSQSCSALIEVERRSELRRRYKVDVNAFQTDLETFGQNYAWRSVDRSSGGIGVRSDRPVDVGSTYVLSRSDQTSFSRLAKVVRCEAQENGYTIGLQRTASLYG